MASTTKADAGHIFATQASIMQNTHLIDAGSAINRGCCTSGCHRSRQILLPPLQWDLALGLCLLIHVGEVTLAAADTHEAQRTVLMSRIGSCALLTASHLLK